MSHNVRVKNVCLWEISLTSHAWLLASGTTVLIKLASSQQNARMNKKEFSVYIQAYKYNTDDESFLRVRVYNYAGYSYDHRVTFHLAKST